MDFQDFLKIVPQLQTAMLPALAAHLKMAPLERRESLLKMDQNATAHRSAAVLMLIYPKQKQSHLVLIERNTYEGVHSAQIAFPGGKKEDFDLNFEATALRETHQEVGIHPNKIEIIKPFTEVYIPPSNFMVYPFLGISTEEIRFEPDPTEVAQVIELPLSDFMDEAIVVQTSMKTSYSESIVIPAFKIENHLVWGATAMMLGELKEVLKKTISAS